MIGLKDPAFNPISPISFLNAFPALAWTATDRIHASEIDNCWDVSPASTPAKTSPVPPVESSGPPSEQT